MISPSLFSQLFPNFNQFLVNYYFLFLENLFTIILIYLVTYKSMAYKVKEIRYISKYVRKKVRWLCVDE